MKKGFTLIELLAVIVILAIIALIATPIVLNIINDTKESATLRSAEYYMEAVEQSIMKKSMDIGSAYKPDVCEIQETGNLLCDNEDILLIEIKGEKPTSGEIKFKDGQINNVTINISGKDITQNSNGEFEYALAPGLYDKNDKLILSWDELVSQYDFKNKVENGGADDEVGIGIAGDVIDKIEGASKLIIDKSVTSIGYYAFAYCGNLTSIKIPESVTFIGAEAFAFCVNLTSIKIPESVTFIGSSAFVNCTGLTSITIPEGVTSIEEEVFNSCSNLTSITIPESVTSIGNRAFIFCRGLTSITIPSNVTFIGVAAFQGCESLTHITIPEGATYIGGYAFSGCSSLTTINYTGTNAEWDAIFKGNAWDLNTPSNKVINYNYVG